MQLLTLSIDHQSICTQVNAETPRLSNCTPLWSRNVEYSFYIDFLTCAMSKDKIFCVTEENCR